MGKYSEIRLMLVVAQRATAFLSEGYHFVVKTESVSLMFYSLRHLSNGNTITLIAYPKRNHFVQKRNGVIVASGAIIDTCHETLH